MLRREGVLSFNNYGKNRLGLSDRFSDQVPYEVNPIPSTIPMEEKKGDFIGQSDFPIQSKDLFNGQLFIESMMPDDMEAFKSHLAQLFAYLQKELKLKSVPKVKLLSDEKNANKIFLGGL